MLTKFRNKKKNNYMHNDVIDKMAQHEYNNNKYYTTSAFRYIYIYIYVCVCV